MKYFEKSKEIRLSEQMSVATKESDFLSGSLFSKILNTTFC